MYNEKEDFLHHENEVNEIFASFEHRGIDLGETITVLDVGAGQGMHAGFLVKRSRKVYCIDVTNYNTLYDGQFLKLLKEKYQRNQLADSMEKICFIENSATEMIFKDDLFDLTISINSLEHMLDPQRALSEMVRVTKPGGYLYISFDPVWTADTGNHFFHRIGEPWAHLVLSTEQFVAQMLENGAGEQEVSDFQHGLNRLRPHRYKTMFEKLINSLGLKLVEHVIWSGVVQDSHLEHSNLALSQARGYDADELLLRGMRYILGKPARHKKSWFSWDRIREGCVK